MELEDDNLSSSDSKLGEGESSDREESESTLILYKLLEFQKVNELLYEELQKARNEYELATGTSRKLENLEWKKAREPGGGSGISLQCQGVGKGGAAGKCYFLFID